jgi:hypothetical protein
VMKPLQTRGFRHSRVRQFGADFCALFRHQCLYSEICDWFAGD